VFDMISTTAMVMLGRVHDNKMVNVKLINDKITDRAVKMLMELSGLTDYEGARSALLEAGSVQAAMDKLGKNG
jgi:N-acetylmuramic acid 6-phosphate etherase